MPLWFGAVVYSILLEFQATSLFFPLLYSNLKYRRLVALKVEPEKYRISGKSLEDEPSLLEVGAWSERLLSR